MSSLLYQDITEIAETDAQQAILDDLQTVGFTATAWQPFSIARLTVDLGAEIKSELASIAVVYKKAFNITTAAEVGDEAVEACALGQFNLTKVAAVTAQYHVTLTVGASSGPYTVNVGDLIISGPTADTYRLVDVDALAAAYGGFPLTLSAGQSYTLGFESEVAGSRANIADAATAEAVQMSLVTTLAGVSIASYSLTRSGVDDESNERIVERCLDQWALLTAKNLIDEGVEGICLAASASIISAAVDSSNPRGADTYDVYLAGLDRTASPDDVAAAQSALMRYEMNKSAPLAKQAPEVEIPITGVVYYAGIDEATLRAAVDAALLALIRAVPPGGETFAPYISSGVVRKDLILDAINGALVNGTRYVRTVTLTSPTDDFGVPTFGKVKLTTTSGLTYLLVTN